MKTLFTFVGFIVVLILLASTGIIKGDVCLENVTCVKMHGSITFGSPDKP